MTPAKELPIVIEKSDYCIGKLIKFTRGNKTFYHWVYSPGLLDPARIGRA